jgi:hypothetical protein
MNAINSLYIIKGTDEKKIIIFDEGIFIVKNSNVQKNNILPENQASVKPTKYQKIVISMKINNIIRIRIIP